MEARNDFDLPGGRTEPMKPLFDAVVVTATQNVAKAINLYLLGGVMGLFLGVTASILTSQTRRSEAAHLDRANVTLTQPSPS